MKVSVQSTTLPACLPPWQENPYRLVSLWDMLQFGAHKFILLGDQLRYASSVLSRADKALAAQGNDPSVEGLAREIRSDLTGAMEEIKLVLAPLRQVCLELGLKTSAIRIERMLSIPTLVPSVGRLSEELRHLNLALHDDLASHVFYLVQDSSFISSPMELWGEAGAKLRLTLDIEEASKCFAFGRYTACVFHLMRVVEGGVIALGKLIDPNDYKPQFSSVLKKIERQLGMKWQDWPETARPYKPLFEETLPHLFAIKKSWRDQVDHFNERLALSGFMQDRESVLGVYNSTAALMRILAEKLPS